MWGNAANLEMSPMSPRSLLAGFADLSHAKRLVLIAIRIGETELLGE